MCFDKEVDWGIVGVLVLVMKMMNMKILQMGKRMKEQKRRSIKSFSI